MSSSLARQLLDLKRKEKDERPHPKATAISILFSGASAKNLEIEKLYALVQNAIEDLEGEEPLFTDVKYLLFQQRSTHFRRSQLKKEALDTIEAAVSRTIALLGPFFLHPGATYILEYLFRVYEAHAHHKESIILAFLPFCESALFTKLIQQLNLEQEFSFLNQFAIKGKILTQHDLGFHAARGNLTFLVKGMNYAYDSQLIELKESYYFPRAEVYSSFISGLLRLLFLEMAGMKQKARSNSIMALMPLIARILANDDQGLTSLRLGTTWSILLIANTVRFNEDYTFAFISQFLKLTYQDPTPILYLKAIVRLCDSQEIQCLDSTLVSKFYPWIEEEAQVEEDVYEVKLKSLLIKSLVPINQVQLFQSLLQSATLQNRVQIILELFIYCCVSGIKAERIASMMGSEEYMIQSLYRCLGRVNQSGSSVIIKFVIDLFTAHQMKQVLLVKGNNNLIKPSQLFTEEKEERGKIKYISQIFQAGQFPQEVLLTLAMSAFTTNQSQQILEIILDRIPITQEIVVQIESFLHLNSRNTRYSSQFVLKLARIILRAEKNALINASSYLSLYLFTVNDNADNEVELSEGIRSEIPTQILQKICQKKAVQVEQELLEPYNSNRISTLCFDSLKQNRRYIPKRLILFALRNLMKSERRGLQGFTEPFKQVRSLFTSELMKSYPDELLNLLYECIEKASSDKSSTIAESLILLEVALRSDTYLPLALLLLKQVFKKQSISALYQIANSNLQSQTAVNSLWLAHELLVSSSQFPSSQALHALFIYSLLMLIKHPPLLVVNALLQNLGKMDSFLLQKGSLPKVHYSKIFLSHERLAQQFPQKKISLSKFDFKESFIPLSNNERQIKIITSSLIQIMPNLRGNKKLLHLYKFFPSLQDKISFLSLFMSCQTLQLNGFLHMTKLDESKPQLMKAKLRIIHNNIATQPLEFFLTDYFTFLEENKENQNSFITDLILELRHLDFRDNDFIQGYLGHLLQRYSFERKMGNSSLAEKLSQRIDLTLFKIKNFKEIMISDPLNVEILRSGFTLLLQFETEEQDKLNSLCFLVLQRMFILSQEGIESRNFHKLAHLIFPIILKVREVSQQQAQILEGIITRAIYLVNDISNAYMLKKEKQKEKVLPKFSVLGLLQPKPKQEKKEELDALSDILLPTVQTVHKILRLMVEISPLYASQYFPSLIKQLEKQSIKSDILHKLKGSVCFAEGMDIHEDILNSFFRTLSSLLLKFSPTKHSYSLIKSAIALRFKFENAAISQEANNQRRKENIETILNSIDVDSDKSSYAIVTIMTLHKHGDTNNVFGYYQVTQTYYFYLQFLSLLLLPLVGTQKSFRTIEKKHMERVAQFFSKQDIKKIQHLELELTNEQISEVLATLLTHFKGDSFIFEFQSTSKQNQISIIKSLYFLLFVRNLAYKNKKVIKAAEKEINVQRKLLKALQEQLFSLQTPNQQIETLTYFINSKKQDAYGSIYDQLLFELTYCLLSRVEKEPRKYYQEYQAFLIQSVLPLFQEGADLWEARFIQLLLNIMNGLIPQSIHLSSNHEMYLETIPSILLQLLQYDLSYPPFKQDLVHMTCVITLTNIVRTYKGQSLSFCNSLFDSIYQKIQKSPQFFKSAGVKCIGLMVESIKDFMSGRMLQIFKIIIQTQDNDALLRAVVHNVPLRSSIKPLIRIYQTIEEKKSEGLSQFTNYCKLMTYLMRYSKDKEVVDASSKITRLYIIMLGFWGQVGDQEAIEIEDKIEIQEKINEAIVQFFLKLKEGELRDIMQQFLEEQQKSQSAQYTQAFYSLLVRTLDTLHHFAVPYFLKVFERLHEQLQELAQNVSGKVKTRKNKEIQEQAKLQSSSSQASLCLILKLIQKSYKYDTKGAISLLCFEMLSEPLSLLYKARYYSSLSSFFNQSLNPCIVQMFDSFDDLDKQRDLLNAILISLRQPLKTENKSAIALLIFTLLETIGDRFLPHLKDTVPFLTQLLEDGDEKVAQEAQKSVYKIESLTGESLKDYI